MAAKEYRWAESAAGIDRLRVIKHNGVQSAALYLPESGAVDVAALQKLRERIADLSIGAYADVTKDGRQVLRLVNFKNEQQLKDILRDCGLCSGLPTIEKIDDRKLREEGEIPPRGRFGRIQLAGIVGQIGLGLMTIQGIYDWERGRRVEKAYQEKKPEDNAERKTWERKTSGVFSVKHWADKLSPLTDRFFPDDPTKSTVQRLRIGRSSGGEDAALEREYTAEVAGAGEETEILGELRGPLGVSLKRERRSVALTEKHGAQLLGKGKAEIESGLTFTAAMTVKALFGGGKRALPYDDMLRGMRTYLQEKENQTLGDTAWLSADRSIRPEKDAAGQAMDLVRRRPIEVVDWLMIWGNWGTMRSGFKQMGENKLDRETRIAKLRGVLERGIRGAEGGGDLEAAEVTRRVDEAMKGEEARKIIENVDGRWAKFYQDWVANYRTFGGGASLLTDLVGVLVPESSPAEIEALKESENPLKRTAVYRQLTKAPLLLNRFLGIIDKPFSIWFGQETEKFSFTQFTVVARNIFFAGYRAIMSSGSKSGADAQTLKKLEPLAAMSANMIMEEAPDRQMALAEAMAQYYASYLLGNRYIPVPDNKSPEQVAAETKELVLTSIMDKVKQLANNSWLAVGAERAAVKEGGTPQVGAPEVAKPLVEAVQQQNVSGLPQDYEVARRGTGETLRIPTVQPVPGS